MSTSVILPPWMEACTPLPDVAVETASLPFTLDEAIRKPHDCWARVSAEQWEEEVIKPLLESIYEEVSTAQPAHFDQYTCRNQESILTETYDLSLAIARCHQTFWQSESTKQVVDFESMWKTRTSEQLKERVTYSLRMATQLTGDLSFRTECPDLSPVLLCENDGRLLWQIVRTITESALRFPDANNYISFVSETWDKLHEVERTDGKIGFRGCQDQKRSRMLCEHRRNYFIALFVSCLCEAMSIDNVLVAPNQLVRKIRRQSYKENWIRLNSFDEKARPLWKWRIDNSNLESLDGIPTGRMWCLDSCPDEMACRACARFAIEVQELLDENKEELSCCSRCAKMDPSRLVAYCSPDCQAQDWKAAHRFVCGKALLNVDLKGPLSLPPSHRPLTLPLQLQLHPPSWLSKDHREEYIYTFKTPLDPSPSPRDPKVNRTTVLNHVLSDETTRQALDTAVSTRSIGDIRRFVEVVLSRHTLDPMSRWRRESITSQIAHEWELDAHVVGDWVLSTLKRKAWVKGNEYVEISMEEDQGRQVYYESIDV